MTGPAWPRLVDRLLQVLPALPGWDQVAVFDGPPVTADAPPVYCTVAYVLGEDFGGTYERAPGAITGMTEETGQVRSEIVCATGDVDLPGMRARAFALTTVWDEQVTADPTLGVLGTSATTTLAVDVAPAQTDAGTVQRLTVTLTYTCRY